MPTSKKRLQSRDKGASQPSPRSERRSNAPLVAGGAGRLVRLLETGQGSGFTRSKGERRMRALLRAAELPQPVSNVPLLAFVADFLWPERSQLSNEPLAVIARIAQALAARAA